MTELNVEIFEKGEGPWPFSKEGCLYCEKDTTHYAYFDDGRHVSRRFCGSKECKEKAIEGVERSVMKGPILNTFERAPKPL